MQKLTKSLTASALLLTAMAASTASAATVFTDLDLAAAGTYSNASATVVKTAQTAGTATFNISYTLGSAATGANSFVGSSGTAYGIGSDPDLATHYNTMEGNDNEIISFLSLSITDFVANDSGYTIADFTDLTFAGISYGAIGNANDGVNISFDSFSTSDNVQLNNKTDGVVYSVTSLSNYSAPEDNIYLTNDGNQTNNRFSINGIQVSYTSPVPEPSSYALLAGLLGLSYVMVRRRK